MVSLLVENGRMAGRLAMDVWTMELALRDRIA